MALAAPKVCHRGHSPYTGNRCPECASAARAASEAKRPSARQRGYDSKWSKESKAFLALPGHQWCACGCGKLADMVDHKTAHKGDIKLFWSRSNWQPYNSQCNRRKAVKQEGAFGLSSEARERARPSGLKPSAVPLTIVCGPSGGGKSHWVSQQQQPLDLVIDLDLIKAKLSGLPIYCASPDWTAKALEERNRLLRSLSDKPHCQRAFYIISAPSAEERQWWAEQLGTSDVVTIAPPLADCITNIQRDYRRAGRVQRFIALATEWHRIFAAEGGGQQNLSATPQNRRPQDRRKNMEIGGFPK